jgi:hypothetical protein
MPIYKNVYFLREESEQYQQPACPINIEAPTEFKKAIKVVCLGTETSLEE